MEEKPKGLYQIMRENNDPPKALTKAELDKYFTDIFYCSDIKPKDAPAFLAGKLSPANEKLVRSVPEINLIEGDLYYISGKVCNKEAYENYINGK